MVLKKSVEITACGQEDFVNSYWGSRIRFRAKNVCDSTIFFQELCPQMALYSRLRAWYPFGCFSLTKCFLGKKHKITLPLIGSVLGAVSRCCEIVTKKFF